MKKKYFKIGVCTLVACMLMACEDKNKENGNDGNVNAETTIMTAQEQKVKLESVATQMVKTFNSEDQKHAVELADELFYKYEDYSWDEVEGYGKEHYAIFRSIARSTRRIVSASAPQMEQSEVYSFPEINATFEANDATRTWEYKGNSDGGIVLRGSSLSGKTIEVKLTGEGNTLEYSREYDGTMITVKLPSKMVYTVCENQMEIIRADINFDIARSSHFRYTMTMKVVNILLNAKANITKNNASASCEMYYGNTELFTTNVELPSCILLDIKQNPTDDDWEEFGEKYEDLEYGVEYGKVIAKANLLKQVQIAMSCENINALYRNLEKVDDKYDSNYDYGWESYRHQQPYNNEIVDLYNKYLDCKVYYSSDIEQAELKFETNWRNATHYDYDTQEYVDWICYYSEPVIYFPKDGTSYAFEDYFTQGAFSNVINLTEDLINSYIKIAKYNEIDPIELDNKPTCLNH